MYVKTFFRGLLVTGSAALSLFVTQAGAIDVTITPATRYQTIEGFGGGFAYRMYPHGQEYQDALYDSIFNRAGVNVIRVQNNYDSTKEANDDTIEINMVKEIQARYPDVKVTMASWSPPKYLKNRDTINGMVYDSIFIPATETTPDTFEMKSRKISLKIEYGEFVYDKYADYWYNAVKDFETQGARIHWVSIQNEPDWPASWDGCYMLPDEDKADTVAGYGKALDAVYKKFRANNLNTSFIATDMTGPKGVQQPDGSFNTLFRYISKVDTSQIAAVSHHFYNGDSIDMLDSIKLMYPEKQRFMTEWLTNDNKNRDGHDYVWTWYNHMKVLHNALTHEDLSMYLIFALAFGTASTHTFFSQDFTNQTYMTRPIYYAFKQYSKSIRRGYQRVDAVAGAGGDSLLVSAFCGNGDSSMAVVMINDANTNPTVNLAGIPEAIDSGVVHQTTRWSADPKTYEQGKKYELTQVFAKPVPAIQLAPYSITTVTLFNKAYPLPAEEMGTPVRTAQVKFVRTDFTVKYTTAGKISVSFPAAVGKSYTVSLFDISGRMLQSQKNSKAASAVGYVNFRKSLVSGTYLVNVTSDTMCETKTVVVP